MSAETTVQLSCDGLRCHEHTSFVGKRQPTDWLIAGDYVLCPRCVAGKCGGTVGQRPGWMSPDQYDPCMCVLAFEHEGDCVCKHGPEEER
jgi:hypothetical protein